MPTDYLIAIIYVYSMIMLVIGIECIVHHHTFKGFILAGAQNGSLVVMLSLLATIIGGSSTIGLLNRALTNGPIVFWWIFLCSLGLVLNATIFAKKIHEIKAYTLPHVVSILVGKEARLIASVIIVISWVGIIAAQFSALALLFSTFFEFSENMKLLFIGISFLVIVYTAFGGQLSILRTDSLQFLLIFFGLLFPCIYMYMPQGVISKVYTNGLGLLNIEFSAIDLLKLCLLIIPAYCFGPDIFSRIFTAKDWHKAKKALLGASFVLFIFAIIMGLIGTWLQVHAQPNDDALSLFSQLSMPWWLAYLFILALISALLSSVDTCLMTAATIVEHDILEGTNITRLRCFIVLIGLMALGLVLMQDQIVKLLIASYSVYVPGIVFPLAVALFYYPKKSLHKHIWLGAVFFGSSCGIISVILNYSSLLLVGMAGSFCLSLVALKYGNIVENKKD